MSYPINILEDVLESDFDGTWGDPVDPSKEGIKVIRSTDMRGGVIDYHTPDLRAVSTSVINKKRLQNGDLLVNKASGSAHLVGLSALFQSSSSEVFLCSNFVRCLRPNKELIDPEFLFWTTLSPDFRSQVFGAQRTTSGLRNLKVSEYKSAKIPFPTLPEQRRIVARIKECLERVEEIERLRSEAQNERESLFESVIEAEFQDADGVPVALSEVCAIKSSLIDPSKPEFIETLHVGGANIESSTGRLLDLRTSREEKLKSSKFPFDEGMVLYNKIRPYLKKVARPNFKGICSADMYPLTPDERRLSRDYLFFVLLSRHFTKYAIEGSNRAGMPKVNRDHLFRYSFRLPKLEQQKAITERLNEAMGIMLSLRNEFAVTQQSTSHLRDAILHKAFAGEL